MGRLESDKKVKDLRNFKEATLLSKQWQTLKTHQADGGFAFA
jgi:hypothetical protein